MSKKIKWNKQLISAIAVGAVIAVLLIWWALSMWMPYHITDTPAEIPSDTISEHDFEISGNSLLLMNTMGIRAYDKNGEYIWDYAVKTANPFITVSGNKIAVADTENGQAVILKKNKVYYEIEESMPISSITVNNDGYSGVISSEHGYRSVFTVYDDFGNLYFKWHSGQNYIVSADISDNNKNMAVAGISTTDNNVQTVINFFNMNNTTPIGQAVLDGEVAYKLNYFGAKVYVLTDKGIYLYNKKGKLKDSYMFTGRTLHAFALDDKDNLAVCLSRTDEAGSMLSGSQVISLSENLKEKERVSLEFEASCMDAKNDRILVSGLRNVTLLKKSGRILAEGTLKNDASRIKLFENGKSFVTLEGSLASVYSIKAGF
ncbi:MAG: hypothetical protein IKJ06_02950 [Clostridia bacterium]|nr:hypothetical protein [Clostridia bacterium]